MDIVSRPLGNGGGTVARSAWSHLFAECFQYCQQSIDNVHDLEEKLKSLGHSVGWRLFGLIVARERPRKRETTAVGVLQFIRSTCWKSIFGSETKPLQRNKTNENEYFIYEDNALPNIYISVPPELQNKINCASFNAGLIRGMLEAAQYKAEVRAAVPDPKNPDKVNNPTVYVVTFAVSPR